MINVEIPTMTIGELSDHIRSGREPVRRSTHIGNQPPKELAVMAGLPPGVDVMMVDTIQGNDRFGAPNAIHFGEKAISLISRAKGDGRVVGSLTAVDPSDGQTKPLIEIHDRPFDQLGLANRPKPMLQLFAEYPEVFRALMQASREANELRRAVNPDGKIVSLSDHPTTDIYGLDGSVGALVTLDGMLAMDTLMSVSIGSESTTHLVGVNTTNYLLDGQRMARVNELFDRSCALLGLQQQRHLYRGVNIQGLGITNHRSQHHLLQTGDTIDLSAHLQKPTGLSDKDRL